MNEILGFAGQLNSFRGPHLARGQYLVHAFIIGLNRDTYLHLAISFQEIFGEICETEIYDMLASMTKETLQMNDTWMKQFGVKIVISEVKKISLSDIFQFESEPHVTKFLRSLSRVANRFAHLIADPIAYKMMLLLLLTMESPKLTKFSDLHKNYLQIFWRQLSQAYLEKSDCDDFIKELFFALHCFQLLTDSMLQLLS